MPVAKATENSYMLPHGPRPTRTARVARPAASSSRLAHVSPWPMAAAVGRRRSGLGAGSGGRPERRTCGRQHGPSSGEQRRAGHRHDEREQQHDGARDDEILRQRGHASSRSRCLGDGGPALRRPGRRDHHERAGGGAQRVTGPARRAGLDLGGPDAAVHRAGHLQVGTVDLAAARPRRVDEAVLLAVGDAGREGRAAVGAGG